MAVVLGDSAESRERSRSRERQAEEPTKQTWNLTFDEGRPATSSANRRGDLNNKPAWMTKGVGVNEEMFGETKGDLLKPGITKADLERLEKQVATGDDPFGDVFREAKKEKSAASTTTAVRSNGPLPSQDEMFGVKSGKPAAVVPRPTAGPPQVVMPRAQNPMGSVGMCWSTPPPNANPYLAMNYPPSAGPSFMPPRPAGSVAEHYGSMTKDNGKFGFITPDDGSPDMFVLPGVCEGTTGLPAIGTKLAYTIVTDAKTGRPRADRVRLLEVGAPAQNAQFNQFPGKGMQKGAWEGQAWDAWGGAWGAKGGPPMPPHFAWEGQYGVPAYGKGAWGDGW